MTIDSATPRLPVRIGRYRVLDRIGRGAMGTVYSAVDEQLGRRVAIKLMLAAYEEDPELRERFVREARITGQLAHRNIVTVFDIGAEEGRPYIVMELLDGLTLSDYLRTEAASTLDARLDLMIQMCEGLQSAHAAGVIHRDIKPSNLLVLEDGTLKLLDFGVARLAASSLTANGILLGTPEYMSPEQVRGQRLDARADVFAAAGVCYFMLAGHPPFGSRNLQRLLHAIVSDEPEPLSDDQAPEPLRRVIMRGLAKMLDVRYQQCADMRADLEQVRRTLNAGTARIVQAACDRYQQVLAVIDERRELGRALGLADVLASCDEAVSRLRDRFRTFATADAMTRSIDRTVATAALEALQARHNAEQAALETLRERGTASAPHETGASIPRAGFWRGLLGPRSE